MHEQMNAERPRSRPSKTGLFAPGGWAMVVKRSRHQPHARVTMVINAEGDAGRNVK